MKVSISLLLTFALCLLAASGALAQDRDISVTATGTGTSPSVALQDAKRNAVEKGIGTLLISQTEIENFELRKDMILTRTVGAVKSYEVVSETKDSDNIHHAKIKAVVSTADIRQDLLALKILLESMDKPQLMVIIDEPGQPTISTAVNDYMTQKGFGMVDSAVLGDMQGVAAKDTAGLAKLGLDNGAEYVIAGKVTKTTSTGSYGMKSGQVSLSVRIVNCSTARILTSKSKTATFAHTSGETAMVKASERAAEVLLDGALFEELVSSFQDSVNNGMSLNVTVRNVPDYKTQKTIKKCLEQLPGTASVARRRFSDGLLTLAVVYKGTADSFSDAADGTAVASGKLKVLEVEGSRIVIDVEP